MASSSSSSISKSSAKKRKIPASPKKRGIGRPRGKAATVGREALVAKTCELLGKLPLKQVTRAAVARSVHAHPSLIRYYFRNRSSMLLAAFEHLTDQFLKIYEQESRGSDGSAESTLRGRVSALCRLDFTFPYFHRLITDEITTMQTPNARSALKRIIDRGVGEYSAVLERGVKDGSLRSVNVNFLFIAIVSLAHGFVTDSYVLDLVGDKSGKGRALSKQYRQFVCDLLLKGLLTRS